MTDGPTTERWGSPASWTSDWAWLGAAFPALPFVEGALVAELVAGQGVPLDAWLAWALVCGTGAAFGAVAGTWARRTVEAVAGRWPPGVFLVGVPVAWVGGTLLWATAVIGVAAAGHGVVRPERLWVVSVASATLALAPAVAGYVAVRARGRSRWTGLALGTAAAAMLGPVAMAVSVVVLSWVT